MPVRIYVHLTWTTHRRLPLINPAVAELLRRFAPERAQRHGARIVELGVVRNHVHALLELPPVFDIPRLVQELKGASARMANRDGLVERGRLQWANGYDLRSIGLRQLRTAIRYVRGQAQRHPDLALPEAQGMAPRDPRAEARARPDARP